MNNSKNKKHIFLSCGSRSGATLTGAILNAHSEISFSTDKIKFFSFVKQRYPKVNKSNLEKLLNEFRLRLKIRWNIPFDIDMCRSLIGSNYSHNNLYTAIILCAYKMDKNSTIIGECENMSWEHIPYFLKKIPNSKALSIIRDPRDVLYSFKKNTIAKKNDYLINVFNSKGLMQSSIKYKKIYKENFYIVKFENLKSNTQKEVQSICKFININFELNMLNENYWMELHGDGWQKWGNTKVSSFHEQETIHSPVARWKGKIDIIDHFIVEWILKKEMIKLGYKIEFKEFNITLFKEAIKRLTSSSLLVKAFSNFLLNNSGSSMLPLDKYNPNYWDSRYIKNKNNIKELAKLMGY